MWLLIMVDAKTWPTNWSAFLGLSFCVVSLGKLNHLKVIAPPSVTQLRTFEPMQTIRHKRVSTFPICNILAFFSQVCLTIKRIR